MNNATISADIISYTQLANKDKRKVETAIKDLLNDLSTIYSSENFYGRIVQGDYIECAIEVPRFSFRLALILKTFVKSIELTASNSGKIKYYKEHGIRLAVAVAPLTTFNKKEGIIDGEAIYLSGRTIKGISTSNKQKVIIKNTMFFCSNNKMLQENFDAIFHLIDTLISKCSQKQSKVVFYKLMGLSEKEISEKLDKSQSTISQHSTAAGWPSIEKSVNYFENIIS